MDLVPWTDTVKILTTCICCVNLAFMSVVGAVGIHRLRASEKIRAISLTVLFAVCVCSADLYLIGVIITNNTANIYEAPVFVQMIVQTLTGCLSIVYLCLVLTVVLRLRITFEGSVWKLSHRVQVGFAVSLSAWVCVLVAINITYYFGVYQHDAAMWIATGYLLKISVLIFFTSSASAVYLFVRNLMRLAESQASSMDLGNPKVNQRQLQMIQLSTKYLVLFLFAVLSSFLTNVVCETLGDGMWGILPPIDLCVNVLCLFLQYPIAQTQYRFACNKVDLCVADLLRRRIERRMRLRNEEELANHVLATPRCHDDDEDFPRRLPRRLSTSGDSICCLYCCCRDEDDDDELELKRPMTPAPDDDGELKLEVISDYDVIDIDANAGMPEETELAISCKSTETATETKSAAEAGAVEMTNNDP